MSFHRLIRTVFIAVALPLLAGFAGLSGAWAAADLFTVKGVEVDVTAGTAAAAREEALAEGHVRAMRKLMERLLLREDVARVRPMEAEEVAQFVRDFEVADERRSDVRYLASLTFRFKADEVRGFLRANGLVHAETRSKPVVVLPVFGATGEAVLWDEQNPWRRAWSQGRFDEGLVPLVVPLGDLGDIAAVDAERALAADPAGLRNIAARYGANDVLITQAVVKGDPEIGGAVVQVGTSRLGVYEQQTVIDNYAQRSDESLDALLARVAAAVAGEVQEAWKQANLLRPGTERKMTVSVPVRGLDDWLEVKRRLRGVAAVQESAVRTISRRETELEITFVGNEDQLVRAMAQSDLLLALDPADGWRLALPGTATQPETAAPAGGETEAAPAGEAPAQSMPAPE